MALPHIYEGTADEIAAQLRTSDLTGKLRAIVVPDDNTPDDVDAGSLDAALADLLLDAERVIPETPVAHTDPFEIAFGETITDKYKKMGFRL